jgi:thiamine-monophosphate kinase
MHEFERIEKFFTPLATHAGALGLKDDAALLSPSAGCEFVITTDAITEGVHFVGNESPASIAKKLLRTNLSDLAAKGAKPIGYQLSVMLPSKISDDWLHGFTSGLKEDQERFGVSLLGGDSTLSKGFIALCITAIGEAAKGTALLRSGALPDEMIVVSGSLAESTAGLKLLSSDSDAISAVEKAYLTERYRIPNPRVSLGPLLKGIASSAMDISDGLMQDLTHLCRASLLGAKINFDHVPLSPATKKLYMSGFLTMEDIVAGGDDYELLFTIPASRADQLPALSKQSGVPLTVIGKTHAEKAVYLDHKGKVIHLTHQGYQHF